MCVCVQGACVCVDGGARVEGAWCGGVWCLNVEVENVSVGTRANTAPSLLPATTTAHLPTRNVIAKCSGAKADNKTWRKERHRRRPSALQRPAERPGLGGGMTPRTSVGQVPWKSSTGVTLMSCPELPEARASRRQMTTRASEVRLCVFHTPGLARAGTMCLSFELGWI